MPRSSAPTSSLRASSWCWWAGRAPIVPPGGRRKTDPLLTLSVIPYHRPHRNRRYHRYHRLTQPSLGPGSRAPPCLGGHVGDGLGEGPALTPGILHGVSPLPEGHRTNLLGIVDGEHEIRPARSSERAVGTGLVLAR